MDLRCKKKEVISNAPINRFLPYLAARILTNVYVLGDVTLALSAKTYEPNKNHLPASQIKFLEKGSYFPYHKKTLQYLITLMF